MHRFWLLLNVLVSSSNSIQYGILRQRQIIAINSSNIQLENFSSISQCLCQSQQIDSMKIIAFNFFTNGTCQLFGDQFYSRTKFYLIQSPSSQVVLFNQSFLDRIQSICCADLSWVIDQIQREDSFRNFSLLEPFGFAMEPETYLIYVTNRIPTGFNQQIVNGKTMLRLKSNTARTDSQPASYHDGLFYVGINPGNRTSVAPLYIYNNTLNRVSNISLGSGAPQRAIWLWNSSIMSVVVRRGWNSTLMIINWFSSISPSYYTVNRSIPIPCRNAYGLTKSRDESFLYVTGDETTIYQISTQTWIWSILVPSRNVSNEIPMALAVDPCDERLWVLFSGFGLRIYDRFTGEEIAEWNLSHLYPTLVDMILTDNYELYLLDTTMNQMIRYGSSLSDQCRFI